MTKRIATAVAVFGAASIISGCAIEQPAAGCIVQDASVYAWQASYTLKNVVSDPSGAGACTKLKGERLGVWKFTDPEAAQATKDANTASTLAIRPTRLASLTRRAYTYDTAVIGKDGKPVKKTVTTTVPEAQWDDATAQSTTLPEMPDSEGFCKATGFAQASLTVEAITNEANPSKVEFPAASRTYQFGDIEVYSHPAAPGTQLRGSLTYSEGDCTAEYTVLALWPSVGCDLDAAANPTEENKASRCGEGSGLNPDFKAVCVAGIGASGAAACVPDPTVGVTLVGKK